MNCRQAHDHIFIGTDDKSRSGNREELQTHLTECADCRAIFESLELAFTSWRADHSGSRVPDADLEWQKLRRRLQESQARPQRSILAWMSIPIGAAAALAIGLFVANGPSTSTPQMANSPAAPTSHSVPASGSTIVYVDDQSGWTFVLSSEGDAGQQHS